MTSRERPDWNNYFMSFARLAATRSTCLRRQVGAALVRNRQILTTGYNGAPRKVEHCKVCIREEQNIPSGKQQETCYAAHAEQNAIAQAAKEGICTNESMLYTTLAPCSICARIIINAGIKAVIYQERYPDDLGKEMLSQAGVWIVRFDERLEDD